MELTKEQKILQQVMSEAWANPTFKEELISNPQQAIKKLTGETVSLPEGKTLQVFDQSNADVVCLNIPPRPNMEDHELSDKDLELVAGGSFPIQFIINCFPPKLPPIFLPSPPILTTHGSTS